MKCAIIEVVMVRKTLHIIKFVLTDNRALGLIGFGILALVVAYSTVGVLQQNYDLQKKIAQQRRLNEIDKLENQKLRNIYFASDEYLELTARRQLNKAAPGEKLYLVPRNLSENSSIEVAPTINDTPLAVEQKSKYQQNIEKWFDFFRGKRD
jgi:cell division protein FtsB